MRYRLRGKADSDLSRLYEEGVRTFGRTQARRYIAEFRETMERITSFPRLARERAEFERPIRAHLFGSHIILYRIDDEGVVVLRIRHAHEDWQSDGEETD